MLSCISLYNKQVFFLYVETKISQKFLCLLSVEMIRLVNVSEVSFSRRAVGHSYFIDKWINLGKINYVSK